MSTERPTITDADLHAWVDGRLGPEEDAAVREWLASHPEESARAAAWRAADERLREAFDPVLDEPVPDRLTRAARRPRRRVALAQVAAGVGWLALGTLIGWHLHGAWPVEKSPRAELVEPAASAHAVYVPEKRHAVEVGATEEAHLVKWLSKRLGHPIAAPDLTSDGYDLVGGRLLAVGASPAAQLMYQNAGGERITLFIRRRPAEEPVTAFRYEVTDDYGVFYWIDDRLAYALTGKLDKAALLGLADRVYDELERQR